MKNISDISAWVKKNSLYFILLLAAYLRLRQLSIRDFWYDEAFTGIAVKESFKGMMGMILQDVHPPLYYFSLKIFASFFNYSVYGIRLYSAIFGILCVLAVYLFTRELFGRKAALFASFIATISPFAIQYSQEGRMYSMFSFFIIMAGYFFVRSLRVTEFTSYRVNKDSILFGIFLGLSALTHYMGIIFAPVFYLVYVVWNVSKSSVVSSQSSVKFGEVRKLFAKILPNKQILIGFITSVLVFSPWIGNFVHHFQKNAGSNSLDWITPASFGDIPVNIQMFIFGTPLGEMSSGMPGPNEFWGVANITVLALITIFITLISVYLIKNGNAKKVLTVLVLSIGFMALVWILSLLGKQFFVARYLLPAGYFIFVLIGIYLARLRLPFSALAVISYLILLFSIVPLGYSLGWNEMSKNLAKYQGNNFYILNSFDYVIAKYYLGADRLTLYNVDWPQYNPDYWAAIGPTLKRTENFSDLRNDRKGLIVSNVQLEPEKRSDRTFDPTGLVLVDRYENILIYKFQ